MISSFYYAYLLRSSQEFSKRDGVREREGAEKVLSVHRISNRHFSSELIILIDSIGKKFYIFFQQIYSI